MGEHHQVAGPARGEPRSAGSAGARVRVPLDAAPSPRWSQVLTARLARDLSGGGHVGHLRLDGLVQGAEIVLDGVEPPAAEALGPALRRGIDAANHACTADEPGERPLNMAPATADAVAAAVRPPA